MTPMEAAELLKRMEYRRHEATIECVPDSPCPGAVTVTIRFPRIPHRETGERKPFQGWFMISADALERMEPGHLIHHIRGRIHEMELHEADECFYVSGVRAFDPHVQDHQKQFDLAATALSQSPPGGSTNRQTWIRRTLPFLFLRKSA